MGGGTGELCTRDLPHWSSLNGGEEEGRRERESVSNQCSEVKHMIEWCILSSVEVPLDP